MGRQQHGYGESNHHEESPRYHSHASVPPHHSRHLQQRSRAPFLPQMHDSQPPPPPPHHHSQQQQQQQQHHVSRDKFRSRSFDDGIHPHEGHVIQSLHPSDNGINRHGGHPSPHPNHPHPQQHP